jgi:hypothetical protein
MVDGAGGADPVALSLHSVVGGGLCRLWAGIVQLLHSNAPGRFEGAWFGVTQPF